MKEKIIHLLIPAFSDNMLRVACRAREFKKYTLWTKGVTCKNCIRTAAFKEREEKEKL